MSIDTMFERLFFNTTVTSVVPRECMFISEYKEKTTMCIYTGVQSALSERIKPLTFRFAQTMSCKILLQQEGQSKKETRNKTLNLNQKLEMHVYHTLLPRNYLNKGENKKQLQPTENNYSKGVHSIESQHDMYILPGSISK